MYLFQSGIFMVRHLPIEQYQTSKNLKPVLGDLETASSVVTGQLYSGWGGCYFPFGKKKFQITTEIYENLL